MGVDVHVVTNALGAEKEYVISATDAPAQKGVTIHYTQPDTPWHIPYSPLYLEKMVDLALRVCQEEQINLIDTHYLIPYGIAGYLVSKLTGIPYLIRHGGSDIHKFWQAGLLSELLHRTLSEAAAVISDSRDLADLNPSTHNLPRYVPDETHFHPTHKVHSHPTYAYIGKINYYWHHKGLDRILEFVSQLPRNSRVVFLAQGKGKEDFLRCCGTERIELLNFIPPWQMPAFLQQVDYLFYFTRNSPIRDFSNLVLEAVSCGARILTDSLPDFDIYQSYFNVSEAVLDIEQFQPTEQLHKRPPNTRIRLSFHEYIRQNINLYRLYARST